MAYYPRLTTESKRQLWRAVATKMVDEVINHPDVPMRLSTTQGTGTYTISPELMRYLMAADRLGPKLMDFLHRESEKHWKFYRDYLTLLSAMPGDVSVPDARAMGGLAALHEVSLRTAYSWRDRAEDILRQGVISLAMKRAKMLDSQSDRVYTGISDSE